jgi:hypothetical protein
MDEGGRKSRLPDAAGETIARLTLQTLGFSFFLAGWKFPGAIGRETRRGYNVYRENIL